MRRALRLPVLAVIACLVPTGCASRPMSVLEQDVARLQDQVGRLERSETHLRTVVDSLSALVAAQTRELRERRAGNEETLGRLQLELQALRTELDGVRAEIAELKDQQRFAPAAPAAAAGGAMAAAESTPRALYDAAYQDLSRGNHELALMGFQEDSENSQYSEMSFWKFTMTCIRFFWLFSSKSPRKTGAPPRLP